MITIFFGRRTVMTVLLSMSVSLICNAQTKTTPHKRTATREMLNGTWAIEVDKPPSTVQTKTADFLPAGLKLQIKLLGPTRLALEENRHDELGGKIVFLPPIPNEICSTFFGTRLCKDSVELNSEQPFHSDAVLRFSTWTRNDPEEIDNLFFASQGARAGSLFVNISLLPFGPEYTLWIKDRSELMSTYTFEDSVGNAKEIPIRWHRVPEP
jgi:hypothetical protein